MKHTIKCSRCDTVIVENKITKSTLLNKQQVIGFTHVCEDIQKAIQNKYDNISANLFFAENAVKWLEQYARLEHFANVGERVRFEDNLSRIKTCLTTVKTTLKKNCK